MTQPMPFNDGWLVLVYRVPPEPSSSRVGIWRDLKRLGALYLQQCVCVVPDRPELRTAIAGVRERVERAGGSSNLFPVSQLPPEEAESLINGFRSLTAEQYAEIIEECETKFVKEIEFEHFRQNYTFAEGEEIEQDLEKIRRWYARVRERDWFDAPGRDGVEAWLERCTGLLDDFFATVHARVAGHDGAVDGNGTPIPPLRIAPVRRNRSGRRAGRARDAAPPPSPGQAAAVEHDA